MGLYSGGDGMKKNKLITCEKLHSIFADWYDWTKWPDGHIYYNPYYQKWKRGRPSKEAYELRDWAAGWDLYFYEQYPRHRPGYYFSEIIKNMVGNDTKIKRSKNKRTVLVKYDQRVSVS